MSLTRLSAKSRLTNDVVKVQSAPGWQNIPLAGAVPYLAFRTPTLVYQATVNLQFALPLPRSPRSVLLIPAPTPNNCSHSYYICLAILSQLWDITFVFCLTSTNPSSPLHQAILPLPTALSCSKFQPCLQRTISQNCIPCLPQPFPSAMIFSLILMDPQMLMILSQNLKPLAKMKGHLSCTRLPACFPIY